MKAFQRSILILLIALCQGEITQSEVVSISEHPIEVKGITNPLEKEIDFSTSIGPLNRNTGPFMKRMSRLLDSFPCPIVCWSDPLTGVRSEVEIDFGTWNQVLLSLVPAISPYRATQHSMFTELVWAEPDQESEFRKKLSESVPPIVFLGNNPSEFLTMWHTLSGMEFRYDTALIKRSQSLYENWEQERSPFEEEESEGELKAIMTVPESVPDSKFMGALASQFGGSARQEDNHWIIGEFKRDADGIALIRSLLSALKGKPFDHGFGEAETTLKKIGLPALPEVLEEYETAEDYHFNALTVILATIHSHERDEVFLKKLSEYLAGGGNLRDGHVTTMVAALADKGNKAAIPTIEKLAGRGPAIRTQAVVALNVLDAPFPPREPASLVSIDQEALKMIETEGFKDSLEILHAAIDQCFAVEAEGQLVLSSAQRVSKSDRPSSMTANVDGVKFAGTFADGKTTWAILMNEPGDAGVWVYATVRGGPLAGAGYEGRAKFRNGRWLFDKWWQTWIS